jgi:chemotaxis response regulator CheB
MSGPAAAPDRPAGWADVAVIGASAGGVGVLQELVTRLPADLLMDADDGAANPVAEAGALTD